MERNIQKAITDYEQRFGAEGCRQGRFYASDIEQIAQLSGNDKFTLIINALTAGFMIGYRCAKYEKKSP